MKNIKTFIIGFLSCACLFLIVGATDYDREESQIGKYQLLFYENIDDIFDDGWVVFDTERGLTVAYSTPESTGKILIALNDIMTK